MITYIYIYIYIERERDVYSLVDAEPAGVEGAGRREPNGLQQPQDVVLLLSLLLS